MSTNATKYGALSVPEGRVSLSWRATNGDFVMVWKESGGPHVEPPQRAGFGSRIIQTMFAHELRGGKAAIAYEADGVRCTFDAPVQALRN